MDLELVCLRTDTVLVCHVWPVFHSLVEDGVLVIMMHGCDTASMVDPLLYTLSR